MFIFANELGENPDSARKAFQVPACKHRLVWRYLQVDGLTESSLTLFLDSPEEYYNNKAMFYNQAKKEANKRLKQEEASYNDCAQQAKDLSLKLYNVRKSAVKAINRAEKYINSLANTPKDFQKDIASITLDIHDFNEAVRIEEKNSDHLECALAAAIGTVAGGILAEILTKSSKSSNKGSSTNTNEKSTFRTGKIDWGFIILTLVTIGGYLGYSGFENKKAAKEFQKRAKETALERTILQSLIEKLNRLTEETKKLKSGLGLAEFNLFPKDYLQFSEDQKLRLGSLINNAKAMGKLINEHIQ